jgi:hypothetical protein
VAQRGINEKEGIGERVKGEEGEENGGTKNFLFPLTLFPYSAFTLFP